MDARAGSLWHKTAGEAIPRNSPRHRGGPHCLRSAGGMVSYENTAYQESHYVQRGQSWKYSLIWKNLDFNLEILKLNILYLAIFRLRNILISSFEFYRVGCLRIKYFSICRYLD